MLGLGTAVNTSGFVASESLFLDEYSGAAAAYSLRKLSSSYSGNCVTVRRDSDNLDANIGFSGGVLDTSALASHCGSANGFVATWFDQSGNSRNATQLSAPLQPKIYDGTTGVVTENGKPAFSLSGDHLDLGSFKLGDPDFHAITVVNFTFSSATGLFGDYPDQNDFVGWTGSAWRIRPYGSDFGSTKPSGQSLIQVFATQSNGVGVYSNNVLIANQGSNASSSAEFFVEDIFTIGGGTWAASGTAQEYIFYPSDQTSNRADIDSAINTFYSIF